MTLSDVDPDIAAAIEDEYRRQEENIELIASENYASAAVMAAQGSVMTNKYAEGYARKRYYGGCEFVDVAEELAIERAKKLFNAEYVNVQPHSGSSANAAVYMALLQPGDVILGMNLSEGGHLTHGCPVNFSGQLYQAFSYGLDLQTGEIDYQQLEELALKHKPKMIIAGFSAYSRTVDWNKFREVSDKVGAYLVADIAHVAGLIATGLYPSPIDIADVVTTTTHKTLRGPRGGMIMASSSPEMHKKLNSAVFPGMQGGPLMHIIAAKAVAFKEALAPRFKVYQQQVIENAKCIAGIMLERDFKLVSGGTDNHLFLIDLIDKNITGKAAEAALESANITLNKNTVPNDPRSPFVTSGLRLGTPAMTTRGFKESEAKQLGHWVCDVLENIEDEQVIATTRDKVLALCRQFPVYQR